MLPAVAVRNATSAAIEHYDRLVAASKYEKVAGRRERLVMVLALADAALLQERGHQFLAVTADDFALVAEHYGKTTAVAAE